MTHTHTRLNSISASQTTDFQVLNRRVFGRFRCPAAVDQFNFGARAQVFGEDGLVEENT